MTETEWLANADSMRMLRFLKPSFKSRKVQLFICAACRHLGNFLTDDCRRMIALIEQHAEDWKREDAGGEDFENAFGAARNRLPVPARGALDAAILAAFGYCEIIPRVEDEEEMRSNAACLDELKTQTHFVRDIFGNPFRTTSVSAACLGWKDGVARKLAHLIYDDRAFDRLPLLADALEVAGCADREILDHCRSGGEHVRGCWVVDLLLGKT